MPVRPRFTYLFNKIDSLRDRHDAQLLQSNYTLERYSSALESFKMKKLPILGHRESTYCERQLKSKCSESIDVGWNIR